jgi:transcriptional regulator with XRE-family HTH domain
MTQARLAAELGMSEASISRIEDGKQPYSQDTLEAIGEALGVDPYQLIKGPPGDTPSATTDLDLRVLELSIDFAIRHLAQEGPPQIARAARVLYRLVVEKKLGGAAPNDETAVNAILEEISTRGDV